MTEHRCPECGQPHVHAADASKYVAPTEGTRLIVNVNTGRIIGSSQAIAREILGELKKLKGRDDSGS